MKEKKENRKDERERDKTTTANSAMYGKVTQTQDTEDPSVIS